MLAELCCYCRRSPSLTAHHTAAIFDRTKTLSLRGTVRQFQWTNPRCFIQLLVPTDGKLVEWNVEMGSPSNLYGSGWRPNTVRPGDQVAITVQPMRDGSRGGLCFSGTTADGTLMIEDPLRFTRPWSLTLRYGRVTKMNRMVAWDCENDRNPVVNGKVTIAPR